LAQPEPRLLAALPALDGRPPSTDKADQKYNQEDKEANLRDGCGDAGDCEESQKPGDESDYEENYCVA
jgi:hypothetical protein